MLIFLIYVFTILAIFNALVDFDKECSVYTETDEEKGVVITLPDGLYKVIQVNTGNCKQPVQDGVFNNVLHHAPFNFWVDIVFIPVASNTIILYIYNLIIYVLNKNNS